MSRAKRDPLYVDVVERVLGGIQITTGNEPRSRATDLRTHRRPFVGGVTKSSVEVSYSGDETGTSVDRERRRKRW